MLAGDQKPKTHPPKQATLVILPFLSRGGRRQTTYEREKRQRAPPALFATKKMGDLADIDDAFDAALNLEETHIDEGWEEGLE